MTTDVDIRFGAPERLSRMIQLPTVSTEIDDLGLAPFEGRIADGFVYGRGALDDKGPLLVTIEAVENLLAAGFTPQRDIYLSFGGNEETYGDGGHASAPPSLTAVARVARAVGRLTPGTFPARTPAAVSRMLKLFSRRAARPVRPLYLLLAASPWLSARVFTRLGGEPAALVRTTVAPTMLDGGTAANVLPSRASATINLRVALGETAAGGVRRVTRRIRDRCVRVEMIEGGDPSPESSTDNAQFALIAAAVEASHPGTPRGAVRDDGRNRFTALPRVYAGRLSLRATGNVGRAARHDSRRGRTSGDRRTRAR